MNVYQFPYFCGVEEIRFLVYVSNSMMSYGNILRRFTSPFQLNSSCSVYQLGALRNLFSDNGWVTLLPDKGNSRTNFFQECRLIMNFKHIFILEKIILEKAGCASCCRFAESTLSCKVSIKDVLGESKSLLRSLFGKIILYLSCAICLCCIL